MDSPYILLLSAALLLVYLCTSSFAAKRRPSLPPGPSPLPFVGNLFDIPKKVPWEGYRDISKKYGNLISLRALGTTVVVIGDAHTAIDLLEKRSANYANRPELKMAKATGWDWSFVFVRYGQWWRDRRRVFWQHFRPKAIQKYQDRQQDGVRRLLTGLLTSPEKLQEHLRYSLTAIVLGSVYGMELAEGHDPNVDIFEKGLQSVEFLISNSSWLEYLPGFRSLPTWLPGTGTLQRLAEIREAALVIRNVPWKHAKDSMQAGNGGGCIAHSMMERISRLDDEVAAAQETIAQEAAGAAYSAAIDTQYATLQRFFVAMNLYPDVQKRAQAELDRVVGRNRMPEAEDRDRLPYVDAVVKEIFRWFPAVPMGVARCAIADDVYEGYLIPKEATVMVNVWAIMHDEAMYHNPERFSPERHLKGGELDSAGKLDPTTIVFGMGRRICPGRYYADATIFMLVASVLHSFDISPRLDHHGQPAPVHPRPLSGIIAHLEDWWQCVVQPRSSEISKPIRAMA